MGESHLILIINTVSNSPVHWPTYQLSKHLVSILSPIVGNSSSKVWNSSDFADFINSQSLQSDETLVSFNVVSLFTNVPVDLVARVANETLADCTGSSPDQITDLLRFCLSATYLAYWGELYKQTFGTVMGSPVSVTVADLVMEDVEQWALSTFLTPPRFWKCYVDDTCTALHPDQLPTFHRHLMKLSSSLPWNQTKMANLHSWILWLHTTLMDPSQPRSIERQHTLTNILISDPTTPWPTRLRCLEHSFDYVGHCALMLRTLIKKWAMWWRLWSGMGIPSVLLRWANPRDNRQTRTMSAPVLQCCYPTFVGCRSLSEESWHPFILERVFVRTEPYPTFLFTQKILCHLTRERELCIEFHLLTVTWYMLARQDAPSRSAGKNM